MKVEQASRSLSEYYTNLLIESKGKAPPNFDDTSRGVLLALIKERPTIWNSTAKLTKDDVLASFQQCSAVLSNMDPSFGIWAIIEKWCWVVESFVRCSMTNPPSEWRYNNTLEYLKPFAMIHYPYLGCISKKRRNELTEMYADPEILKVSELTDDLEFPAGIFRDEMHVFSGEEILLNNESEANSIARTVGQIINVKRRGRPSKADKRSPVDQFINLTPQSAQFQKLLEVNGTASTSFTAVSFLESDAPDDLGFTPAMYNALIEMIQETPQLWQNDNPNRKNGELRDKNFDDISRKLILKFNGSLDIQQSERMTGSFIRKIWETLKEKFQREEKLDKISQWRYYLPLQFLSNRLMPAFLLENVFIKSEDPSTSTGLVSRVNVASPAGSSQSEDSRMATSSPASATQFVSNGNKSIKTVLDNLVARSMKEEQGLNGISIIPTTQDYSELKQMLEQNKLIKVEGENGPPMKRAKQDSGSSPPGNSRMIVYNNDTRKAAQAPIATWVPPREDLAAKVKEEVIQTPPQKRPQATAVIKSGIPLERHLKKMFQQSPTIIPTTAAASIAHRNGILGGLNAMSIPQSALQQALLKKMEPPTTMAATMATMASAMPSVSAPQLHQAQALINGAMNGNSEPEDKWTLLGRMISMIAREVEARDPMAACELTRDIQQCLYQYNSKSLRPKENNSQ
ncbi:hypothetical protein CRE_11023 [Caenorhabditis remanei]|uniref:MADF domain-containing protein n=1 Tax=Caenorhabditis remanei TaxID=31234 RepID=E3M508_CAERE|nr:hypothetical protein CRE_11023 [Caenorhabditis remanei]